MDVIPSLCASSASCGAAAIGYVFGGQRRASIQVEPTGAQAFGPTTPQAPRQSLSSLTAQPSKSALRRSRPVSVARNHTQPGQSQLGGVEEGLDWRTLLSRQDKEQSRPNTSRESKESPFGTAKSSWLRRLSTVTPSSLNDSSNSTTQPGTPTFYAHGSNPPLDDTPSPVTRRNRLVKRSTSQAILPGPNRHAQALSSSLTSTFRRPATSYQRSEQSRLQGSRNQVVANNGWSIEISREREQGRESFNTLRRARDPAGSTPQAAWDPYFHFKPARIRDTPSKNPSSLSRDETIHCVEPPTRTFPTLLLGSSVLKPTRPQLSSRPYTPRELNPLSVSTPSTQTKSLPIPTNAGSRKVDQDTDNRARNSFSVGDTIPQSSPSSWKLRKGGSLRKKMDRERQRVVSAPHRKPNENMLPATQSPSEIKVEKRPQRATETPKNLPMRSTSSPLPPLERLSAFEIELPESSPTVAMNSLDKDSTHLLEHSAYASPMPFQTFTSAPRLRSHRNSRVPSDRDSTAFGSDNEHSRVFSVDGEDIDYRSETIYDSIRTDATGSVHSGARGHRLESVFNDHNTADIPKHSLRPFQGRVPDAALTENSLTSSHAKSTPEKNDELGAPTKIAQSIEIDMATPSRSTNHDLVAEKFSSPVVREVTPRMMHRPSDIHSFADDYEDWSLGEEEDAWENSQLEEGVQDNVLKPFKVHAMHFSTNSLPLAIDLPERPKPSLRPMAEHLQEDDLKVELSSRPRTSYTKQVPERGSRAPGRSAPSGLHHLRSQSVPVPPEKPSSHSNNLPKLESWRLGGKGASEDWDGDFVFDEPGPVHTHESTGDSNQPNSPKRSGVVVPPAILETQASVHGQFGQVKEFSLQVEELKLLRAKAVTYGIIHGQASELWKESDSIIDLASSDEPGQEVFPPHSPTSTSFDYDAFEDEDPSGKASSKLQKDASATSYRDASVPEQPSTPTPSESTPRAVQATKRKDSVARATFVVDNMAQSRSTSDSHLNYQKAPKKVAFDTTSLRDLSIRAGVLLRVLREEVKRHEDPDYIPNTPERSSATPPDPPFSQIFHNPGTSPSSIKKSPRAPRKRSSSTFLGGPIGNDNDVTGHAQAMTVV